MAQPWHNESDPNRPQNLPVPFVGQQQFGGQQPFGGHPLGDPQQRLADAIFLEVSGGGRVEIQEPGRAVIVHGQNPNHTLHLILTIFTCLLWAPVWLLFACLQRKRTVVLSISPEGMVVRRQY